MIGVCTDSNAQLPLELAARLGVQIVPLTVTVDGIEYAEGVDLGPDDFWARFASSVPSVATAAPSPAAFLAAWEELALRGASEIVSVHVGSEISGTLNAAFVASRDAPVPVHLVDTRSASFVVAFAAWAAAEAATAGADVDAATAAAAAAAQGCGNVFVVGTLDLARAGGRLADGAAAADAGLPVLALVDGQMHTLGRCHDPDDAAATMAAHVLAAGKPLRVGVGASDRSSFGVADALAASLMEEPGVQVVRYRVGPSVGAHTGPGTAGAVFQVRRP